MDAHQNKCVLEKFVVIVAYVLNLTCAECLNDLNIYLFKNKYMEL